MVSQRLRLLQGIAAILILLTIVLFIINGQSLFDAVVVGTTFAVYAFLPIALVFLLYWLFPSSDQDDII